MQAYAKAHRELKEAGGLGARGLHELAQATRAANTATTTEEWVAAHRGAYGSMSSEMHERSRSKEK